MERKAFCSKHKNRIIGDVAAKVDHAAYNSDKNILDSLNGISVEQSDSMNLHNRITLSGKYYFVGCKISISTRLKVLFSRSSLNGRKDRKLCDLIEYDFPIGCEKENHD